MTIIRTIFELTAPFAYLGLLGAAALMVASLETRTLERVRLEAREVSRHRRPKSWRDAP